MTDYESDALPDDVIELRAWMSEWYDRAVMAGFIRPPYTLDDVTAERLEGYFRVGLTPAEGADAVFRMVH